MKQSDKIKNRHVFCPSESAEQPPNTDGKRLMNLCSALSQQASRTSHMQHPWRDETLMYNSTKRDTAHSTINHDV